MELIDLKAEIRKEKGKGAGRALRRNQRVPGIVYGSKTDPVMISVSMPDLDKVVRENGFSGVFLSLSVEGDNKKSRSVMLRETQMDIFATAYFHVDFHEIDMDTEVTVNVAVEPVGEPKGVSEGDGMLQIIRRELEVVCKPADMPESIEVDVTDLDVGDSVHVSEIRVGENIEIPYEVDFTVLTVSMPTYEAEEEEEELLEEGEELGEEGEEAAADAGEAEDESPAE